ncbi:MAG: DUF433 domain-containing protein [Egibacteraceae bacterium]
MADVGDSQLLSLRLFTVRDGARLLSLPTSTLSYWLRGSVRGHKVYDPVLRETVDNDPDVTWGEFIEAGLIKQLRARRVPLGSVRRFSRAAHLALDWEYPLARHDIYVGPDRKILYEAQRIARLDKQAPLLLVAEGGEYGQGQQYLSGDVLRDFLEPIAFQDDVSVQYRPRARHADVVVDPRVRFGAPQIQGVPTEALWSQREAGDSLAGLAEDFVLPLARVEEAIAFERDLRQRAAA